MNIRRYVWIAVIITVAICLMSGCGGNDQPPVVVTGEVQKVEWKSDKYTYLTVFFTDGRQSCFYVPDQRLATLSQIKPGHTYAFEYSRHGWVEKLTEVNK